MALMNLSLCARYMPDENLIFLKPVFTWGFDAAHKIQALST